MNDALNVALFRGESAAELIPIQMIEPWEHNPRRTMDHNAIAELATSIGKVGVLQPILVRPIRNNAMFGIVSGERRWRAAKFAGQTHIPAVVRTLTDAEALEIAVTENLQREDVPPLEEAEGYARLQSQHGYTVEEIADKVGKSKAYVYARLKLTALCEEARELVREHSLSPTVALLIARIPTPSQQVEAAKTVAAGGDGQPLSATRAATLIRGRYMLRLADAKFPTDSTTIVPAAGACTECPKRTGNQPELFGDIQEADTCTDSVCFEGKAQRWFEFQAEQHEAEGGKVYRAGTPEHDRRYQDFFFESTVCDDDNARRTWGEIIALAKKPPTPVLMQTYIDEPEWIRAWPRKTAYKVAEKLGIERKARGQEEGDDDEEESGESSSSSETVTWGQRIAAQRFWHAASAVNIVENGSWSVSAEAQACLWLALQWLAYDGGEEVLEISLLLQNLGLDVLDPDDGSMVAEDNVLAQRIQEMDDLKKIEKAFRLCLLRHPDLRDWLPAIATAHNIDIGPMPYAEQS
jgi:ParB/RepB/Spo0J family partition protein